MEYYFLVVIICFFAFLVYSCIIIKPSDPNFSFKHLAKTCICWALVIALFICVIFIEPYSEGELFDSSDSDDHPALTTRTFASTTTTAPETENMVFPSIILNTHTKIAHYDTCSWVDLIAPEHIAYCTPDYPYVKAREDGYRPCEHCMI